MATIDYFFSVLSPFTYLTGDHLERIAARHGAGIRYKPIDIIGLFGRTGGVPPKDRHPSRKAYRLQDLARISKLRDMDINLSPAHWPTNPAPASCAIIAAANRGQGDVGLLAQRILRSCWLDDLDIADAGVVADCLAAAGCPRELSESVGGSAEETLRKNTDEAVSRNVFGSPTYAVGDEIFWGQDRLGHLESWLSGDLSD